MTTRRLTTSEIEEAYKAVGGKPHQGIYTNGFDGYCALGVLRRQIGGPECYDDPIQMLQDRGYEPDYLLGVISGFDGMPRRTGESEIGYQDGRAIWDAVSALTK